MTTYQHAILANSTDYQQTVEIEDEYGNKDFVHVQPKARVKLPYGNSVKKAPPLGVYYTPAVKGTEAPAE